MTTNPFFGDFKKKKLKLNYLNLYNYIVTYEDAAIIDVFEIHLADE